MKQYQRFFLIFLILCFYVTSSSAQEVWDWEKCIDYALKNNIQVKQSDLNILMGETTVQSNKMNYSPDIYGASNYNVQFGNVYNFYTNQYDRTMVHYQDMGLNISQPIFDGLVTPNNVKKSKLDLQALKLDQEKLQNDIQLQILTAFLNIMNANEQYAQAKNQRERTQEQYDRIKTMINAGAAAENALLDVDAQLTSEDLTISQIKNQLDLTYLNLKVLLQLDLKKDITIKIPELPNGFLIEELEDVYKVYEDALNLRPEVKSSQLKIQSAEKQISAAKGNYWPSLNFIGNMRTFISTQFTLTSTQLTGNTTPIGFVEGTLQRVLVPETVTVETKNKYGPQLNQNLNFALGLSLNIPIFNKYQIQTAVKQSKIQYENALLTEKQTSIDLFNSIQQAHLKSQASIANFKAAEKNYETAKKSYEYAIDRLELGSINQLEVNLAKTNLDNSLSKLTQSKYEYLFNTKLLDFYQGKKIEL